MSEPRVKTEDVYAWGAGIFAAAVTATLIIVVVIPYDRIPTPGHSLQPLPIINQAKHRPHKASLQVSPGQTNISIPKRSAPSVTPSPTPGPTRTPGTSSRPSASTSGPGKTTPRPRPSTISITVPAVPTLSLLPLPIKLPIDLPSVSLPSSIGIIRLP
jgi:hypothetical protein